MSQNCFYGLSSALVGAAIVVVQPQIAAAQVDEQAIATMAKSVTVVINGQNPGSGAIVGKEGNTYKVITAKHVVATPDQYEILTPDGTKHNLDYRTVKKFPNLDLAVVEFTSEKNYPIAPMGDSNTVTEGSTIYISGWPHPGQAITQRIFQITSGKISGRSLGAAEEGYELVYTNITRSGMSGGPIFNASGHLIGIHGRAEGDTIYNPETGDSVAIKSGFNLGIPINNFYQKAELTALPKNSSLVRLFGAWGTEFHQKNKLPEALNYYQKVLALEPKNVDAIIHTGLIEYETGKVEAAIGRWQQAVQLAPDNGEPQLAIAAALYAKGDRQKALTMAKAALRLNPNYATANEYLKKQLWSDRLVKDTSQVQAYFLPSKTFEAKEEALLEYFAIHPQSRMLAYSLVDNLIALMDLNSGQLLRTFMGHSSQAQTFAFSPNGQILASGSIDNTIKLWNLATGKEIRTLTGHSTQVWSIAFSPDGQILASLDLSKNIKLWNVSSGQEIRTIKWDSSTRINGLALIDNGKTLVSCNGEITKFWDVSSGRELKTFNKVGCNSQRQLAISPDGKRIALFGDNDEGTNNYSIKVLNINTGQELCTFSGYNSNRGFGFSPDGRYLAGFIGSYLHVWDVNTGMEQHFFVREGGTNYFVGFTPDGQRLITAEDGNNKIEFWQIP